MKKLFTILFLGILFSAKSQYFQRFYNVTTTAATVNRDEVFNSGIRTTYNYALPPDSQFLVSVGTSYGARLASGVVGQDQLRFAKTSRDGSVVPINLGYEFTNSSLQSYNSSGNSVAEIRNTTGNGGFISVGAVTSNYTNGATLVGGSDALIARFNSVGTIVSSTALNFANGADTAWCIRRSNFTSNTFLVCGQSRDTLNNIMRCFVARITSAGAITWANTFVFDLTTGSGVSANCIARQICDDRITGNIYAVGTQEDLSTASQDLNGLVFSLNSAGGLIWSNIYQASSDDQFKSVRLTADRNLIVGGHTNFTPAGLVPFNSNMLLLKIRATSGAIMWQSLHRVVDVSGSQFDSKCFDVLERKFLNTAGTNSYEYYMAGPAYATTGSDQIMYRVKSGGTGINSYTYNKMKIDSLFALDIDSFPTSRGIFMFSSLNLPGGISSSHIVKTTYQGATCTDLCVPNPPKNLPIQMIVTAIPPFTNPNYTAMPIGRKKFYYKSDLICTQAALNCNNPRALPTTVEAITKTSKMLVYPNPANDEVTINTQKGIGNPVTIRLMNAFGQQVWQGKINGIGKINMRTLTPGMYFVHSDDAEGGVVSKVIKR